MDIRQTPKRQYGASLYNSAMNTTDDHDPQSDKRLADESDLGPEPDWLALAEGPTDAPPAATVATSPTAEIQGAPPPPQASSAQLTKREHPWMWALIPLVFVGVTGLVAWFASWQTLNGTTIWRALAADTTPLLPARWSLLSWWAILPLLAVVLLTAIPPSGRIAHRIRLTGPLVIVATSGTILWMIAELWRWQTVAFGSILIATLALALYYLVAVSGTGTMTGWQRWLRVTAVSGVLAYSCMLLVITVQQIGWSPLGVRGTSVVLMVIAVIIAAVFALFMKDGAYATVTTIWFLGVAQRQWGNDTALSLAAIVAVIFCAISAGMGVILAAESRSGRTSTSEHRRGRIDFFRRNTKTDGQELP